MQGLILMAILVGLLMLVGPAMGTRRGVNFFKDAAAA
jgi:hypothetical protein